MLVLLILKILYLDLLGNVSFFMDVFLVTPLKLSNLWICFMAEYDIDICLSLCKIRILFMAAFRYLCYCFNVPSYIDFYFSPIGQLKNSSFLPVAKANYFQFPQGKGKGH